MFKIIFLPLLLLSISHAFGVTDLCEILDSQNCAGISKQRRRSSAQSLPTASTASNLNPANASSDRGFGVEMLQQANNPMVFSLASGTGRFGAALISSNLENSFFSNRAAELDPPFSKRRMNNQQYRTKKQSLALGAGIIRQRNIGMDLGIVLKRNQDIGKINTGIGGSLRAWIFHVGASAYKDDMHLNVADYVEEVSGLPYTYLLNVPKYYEENFYVSTFSGGVKLGNLFLDYASIKSKTKIYGVTTISILSGSYAWKNILVSAAMRTENSFMQAWENNQIQIQQIKKANYYSLQYSVAKPLILGVHYNYFLLKEISLGATVFF